MPHNTSINSVTAQRWFYLFLCAHLIFWTLVPALVRYNLPLDAIEGTIWGHQLQWGYDKNPWLNGWLTALATLLDGQSGYMIYLFSQLCVIACLWSMWRIAKNILSPVYALVSVLVLECIQYFNFHAIDFNDNTLELGLWGLSIYYFYRALRTNSFIPWMLTGLLTALGLMAKYYTLTLIAAMFLFLILHPENRKHLKTIPPYVGLSIFILICLPHVFWLFTHDFITIQYVIERGSNSVLSWKNHIFYPLEFLWQQVEAFLPALIPFLFLLIGRKPILNPSRIKIASFDKSFLFVIACGPLFLTLLLCVFLGTKLRAGWGMPLISAWGIMLTAIIQPNITRARLTAFISMIFILLGLQISGYSISLLFPSSTSSANFPGREIAITLTREWHEKFHTRLAYVGGSRWVGGNIEFYSPDHPAVFVELDEKRAPWINQRDLREKGGIFVWEISEDNDLPERAKQKFLGYKNMKVMEFNWLRKHDHLSQIKIGVVVLPPDATI